MVSFLAVRRGTKHNKKKIENRFAACHLLVVQCRNSTLLRVLFKKKWLKDHRHPSVNGSPSMSGEYE